MARIDRLGAGLKSIVRVASVIGPIFEEPLMETLLQPPISRRTLRSGLAELQRLGFLRADHERPGVHAFSHIVARDAVYESLPFTQRRRLHGSVLHHLETRGASPRVHAELLLHHAEQADDMPRVTKYAALSGDHAAAVFANTAALDYYRKSLDALSRSRRRSPADESVIMERIAGCEESLGRHKQAAATCAAALDVWLPKHPRRPLIVPGPRLDNTREAVLCRKIGVSLERDECDYDSALDWLRRAVAAIPPRRPRLSAQVCGAMCVSLFRKGLHEEGIVWGSRALAFALRSREPREVAYARNMLATCYMERGDLARAIRHLRRAVKLYHELGDFPGQASANNNLGMCYHLQGTLDAALYYYQVALNTDDRVGDQVDAAIVQGNIGEVLLALGRIEEAVENLSTVVHLHERGGGLAAVAGLAYVNLSRCQLVMGDMGSAERHLRRGRRLLKNVGAEALLLEADLQHAEILLAGRRYAAAITNVRRSLSRIRELRAQLLECRGERILGEALAESGRAAAAEEHIRAGILLARKVGAGHEEARSALALAKLLLRSGRARSRAAAYLRRADRIFRRMGAEHELRKTSDLSARAA
jgi:tetratricopeptide (TPR) repeat protein